MKADHLRADAAAEAVGRENGIGLINETTEGIETCLISIADIGPWLDSLEAQPGGVLKPKDILIFGTEFGYSSCGHLVEIVDRENPEELHSLSVGASDVRAAVKIGLSVQNEGRQEGSSCIEAFRKLYPHARVDNHGRPV